MRDKRFKNAIPIFVSIRKIRESLGIQCKNYSFILTQCTFDVPAKPIQLIALSGFRTRTSSVRAPRDSIIWSNPPSSPNGCRLPRRELPSFSDHRIQDSVSASRRGLRFRGIHVIFHILPPRMGGGGKSMAILSRGIAKFLKVFYERLLFFCRTRAYNQLSSKEMPGIRRLLATPVPRPSCIAKKLIHER